jgi:hypothetical protein
MEVETICDICLKDISKETQCRYERYELTLCTECMEGVLTAPAEEDDEEEEEEIDEQEAELSAMLEETTIS